MTAPPVLHVLAGPNGSGKSSFVAALLQPVTGLPFVNADVIAHDRWPGDEEAHAYEAARIAAQERSAAIDAGTSFIAETVFSHPSKLDLIADAVTAGYLVELHVMLVPEDVAVARVADRVLLGGHRVPEPKIRERYRRLWPLVAIGAHAAAKATFYDNSRSGPGALRTVARLTAGRHEFPPGWPRWVPRELLDAL
ncbi:MAG: zeta toxin family protein [Solirubrobacteraceae bacterium]|nr:zeta toxin family protein [Solirubrobacteraceae bacterium]